MKKQLFFLSLIAGLMISACNHTRPIVAQDLLHHRFKVISSNNQQIINNQNAYLEFGENLTINGEMCNAFSGQVTLNNNVIKSQYVNMTDKLCDDTQLNQLDSIIVDLLTHGATMMLDNSTNKLHMRLNDQKNNLVFELNDLM